MACDRGVCNHGEWWASVRDVRGRVCAATRFNVMPQYRGGRPHRSTTQIRVLNPPGHGCHAQRTAKSPEQSACLDCWLTLTSRCSAEVSDVAMCPKQADYSAMMPQQAQ